MPVIPLIIIIISGLVFAFLGLSYKMAAARNCRPVTFTGILFFTAAVLSGWLTFYETTFWSNWRLWALGATMGFIAYFTLSLVVVANRLGPASVVWTLVNLSGLVPIFLSPILLHDDFLKIDIVLLLLFCAMIIAMQRGMAGGHGAAKGKTTVFWLILMFIFFANGISLFCNKLKNTFFQDDCSAGLAFISYICGGALAVGTHLLRERNLRPTRNEWLVGCIGGLCSSLGCICMLHGMSLPAIVAFPVSQGISLLCGVGLTTLIYHEAITAGKAVGLFLGLSLIFLAVFRVQADVWMCWP